MKSSLSAFAALIALASTPLTADAAEACCSVHEASEATQNDSQPLSRLSLYQVASVWTNQDSRTEALDQLVGRPQIAAMAYTHCEYACPRLLADLKAIEESLAPEQAAAVGFTIITIDPERDTPERLADYAVKHNLEPERWTLLTGSPSDTLELANLLGVRYKPVGEADFSHSNRITLLDAHGEIVTQLDGLGADPAPLLAKLRELLLAETEL